MYGAIIGDIAGSTLEFSHRKSRAFPFFLPGSDITDDSIMTLAVARALVRWKQTGGDLHGHMRESMRLLGRRYPHPLGAYGSRFAQWLRSDSSLPYYSCGNGSAMRVSPCALIAASLEEALELANISARVTHNHPEGIRGAQATAAAIYLARTGSSIPQIRDHIAKHFYPLDRTLSEIAPTYRFEGTCQRSVPESIQAFLESHSYTDALRNTIALGGDTDTMGAITGSIAWAYYGRDGLTAEMADLRRQAERFLPPDLKAIAEEFEALCAGI